jgi:hypothetical protein
MTGPTPFYSLLPNPHPIPYYIFNPESTAKDRGGNLIPQWNDSVILGVQGWDILTSEYMPVRETEEKYSVFLEVPPAIWPNIRDRFGLPIPDNNMIAPTQMFSAPGIIASGIFEVVGHDIEQENFTNWRMGNIILLKAVVGG